MNDNKDPLRHALENARISYHQGNRSNTRYWAQLARISTKSPPKSGSSPHLWVGILVLLAVISCALVSPAMGFYINTLFLKPETLMAAQVGLRKASNTPTPS